jgi:tetratricopeptide (TPR) repeat protein
MRRDGPFAAWMPLFLAIGMLGLSFLGCGPDKKEEAKKHFKVGIQYAEEKQMDQALPELKRAVELDPNYADARFGLGEVYHALKAYSLAVKEFEEVMRLDPNFPKVHTALANLYYERGLMAWGRAVKLDRTSFWFPDTLRKLPYDNRDGLIKLIGEYQNTVKSDTVDAETFSKLSQAYFVLAGEEYQKAVRADPADTTAQLYLGLTYSEQGYPQKAMARYETVKQLAPQMGDLLRSVLEQKEKEKAQIEEYQKTRSKP